MDKYIEKKTKGLVQIDKVGDAYAVRQKRFNQDTGEEAEPVSIAIDVQHLESKKAELQQQIAGIDELLADCKLVGKGGVN